MRRKVIGVYSISRNLCLSAETSLQEGKDASSTNTENICEDESESNLEECQHRSMCREEIGTYVESHKSEHETEIAPCMMSENVETILEELVRGPECTEFTRTGGLWITKIASGGVDVILHVLPTGLTRGWVQSGELDL